MLSHPSTPLWAQYTNSEYLKHCEALKIKRHNEYSSLSSLCYQWTEVRICFVAWISCQQEFSISSFILPLDYMCFCFSSILWNISFKLVHTLPAYLAPYSRELNLSSLSSRSNLSFLTTNGKPNFSELILFICFFCLFLLIQKLYVWDPRNTLGSWTLVSVEQSVIFCHLFTCQLAAAILFSVTFDHCSLLSNSPTLGCLSLLLKPHHSILLPFSH